MLIACLASVTLHFVLLVPRGKSTTVPTFKEDFNDFRIPENIFLTSLNYDTGLKSASGEKNSITEALKLRDINNLENNSLLSSSGRDKIIKFRQFY